jgi:hypothetical protein
MPEIFFPYTIRATLTPTRSMLRPYSLLIELNEGSTAEKIYSLVKSTIEEEVAFCEEKSAIELTNREANLLAIINEGVYSLSYEVIPHG